ncbi:O-antigen ligase [Duganella sp. FT27W]|uniref:O-antigen ligase family protein n=1 Tax=Duganella sp. FT27W TaxID=2654636 RepID=UPI00128C2F38|nr:hypothetical protein [Duganella sp. FT27W]MPQ56021.1 hypothetical protein [Duganella sp. FT27W]
MSRWAIAGLAMAALAAALAVYPLRGHWLAPLLLCYVALLCWRPALWLFLLPALLPVVDLAPVTGWFFLEEIDLLMLATVACCYGRLQCEKTALPAWAPLLRTGVALMAIACMIGLLRGLWRGLQPWSGSGVDFAMLADPNAFSNYFSPFNAARIAKAWLWTLLLLPLLRRTAGPQLERMSSHFVPGMLAGLLLVASAAVRERVLFPGLLNLSTDYRITAPFSAMHTGGAALDGYLALCAPLVALWLHQARHWWQALAGLALLGLALYAGLATFSRGLYAAYAVSLLVVAAGWWRASAPATDKTRRLTAALAVLLVTAAALAFHDGYYVERRFATTAIDFDHRRQHWRDVLGMMDDDGATSALGMGLGTFPATYYWRNPGQELPPGYRYVKQADDGLPGEATGQSQSYGNDIDEGCSKSGRILKERSLEGQLHSNRLDGSGCCGGRYHCDRFYGGQPDDSRLHSSRFLRLSAGRYAAGYGELLRIWQTVPLIAGREYHLSVDVRTASPMAFLHLRLCERQLLYPIHCIAVPMQRLATGPDWQRLAMNFNAGKLGSRAAPVRLELAVEGQNAVVEVTSASLRLLPDDRELLRNGDFSQTNDYWFFSSDRHHLPWHIKNLALNLYFEMGWTGLLAALLLVFGAGAQLLVRAFEQREFAAAAWLAALAGFQVVGLFDSLVDVPRIALLSMLVLGAASLQPRQVLPSIRRPVMPGSSQRGKK